MSILFLPAKRGGLALPSLVREHKKLQASKMVQLLMSHDPGVRKAPGGEEVAEDEIQASSLCGLHPGAGPSPES